MDAEILLCDGFGIVPPPKMNELIVFGSDQSGSNCDESTVTTEEDGTVFSGDSSPGGAAEEEWPGANNFSFYFVKQPAYDDPEIKTKINEAEHMIYQCNKHRIDISNSQKSKRVEISSLSAQMESLVPKSERYKLVFDEKKSEFDTLKETLLNLKCFSKEELDHLIYIAHGSISLKEEDWVLKETEKLDETSLSEDSLAKKEAFIYQLKSMALELSEVKKELDAITLKINNLTEKMGKIQNKIRDLDVEMAYILENRDKSYERIKLLRIQRDKRNAAFFQSLAVKRKAKAMAASGNLRDLEVFASSEVDRFMTRWNNDKAYRDDYVKRLSFSLFERQLSRDGRFRDLESEVLVLQMPIRKEDPAIHKRIREDSSSKSSQDGNVVIDKEKKEADMEMEFPVYEIQKKEEDEETLKERKREEQLEKARLAMERKRKLQEKAAAKAVIRAQKEAEKKLKECEKKAKKKAAAKSSELEVIREKDKILEVSGKEKHQKERSFPKQRSFRYKHRGRGGTEALPKAILNRRKAHRYWVWGVSSAGVALMLLLSWWFYFSGELRKDSN